MTDNSKYSFTIDWQKEASAKKELVKEKKTEEKKTREKIDKKKLIIYSEIMKPKFDL